MPDLGPILDHLPAWLMVLFRLTGIFILAPVLGSDTIPRIVKVFLVLGLACCVYPMLLMAGHAAGPGVMALVVQGRAGELSLWSLTAAVAMELLIGYVIGYCASLPLIGLQMSGAIIDQQMGISAGGVFNPDLDSEATVTSQLLFMVGLAVFLIIGGHHAIFTILIGSFERLPLGMFGSAADFNTVVDLVLGLLTVTFDMALRIAAPVLCILFLLKVALGFIGRTVPQMNLLSVGFIFYILAGLAIMVVGSATFVLVFEKSFTETLQQLGAIFTM